MPRERDPKRDEAEKLWLDSGGQLDLIDIANRLEISPGTVRGWKSKDKWSDKLNGTFQTGKKRNAPKPERSRVGPQQRIFEQPEVVFENDELTDKQRLFVYEYLRDFNITRSAMAAGYSKRTAHVVGWEVLRNPKVQAEIQRQKEMRTTELGLDVQRIIAEYMKIAFADITDVMSFGYEVTPLFTKKGAPILNEDGSQATTKVNFVDFKNDHEVDGSVISEVKQGKEGISVKLHDKMRALKELEKYLNFMTEEDKLKIEKLRHEVRVLSKDDDDGNEPEDDGFMEALKGIATEVWGNDGTSED